MIIGIMKIYLLIEEEDMEKVKFFKKKLKQFINLQQDYY